MLNVENLKTIMKEKGIKSLKELSRQSGIPYSTINYMLNGHDMCLGTIANIAKALNEPLESFINTLHNYIIINEKNGKINCRNIKASNLYEVTVRYMM